MKPFGVKLLLYLNKVVLIRLSQVLTHCNAGSFTILLIQFQDDVQCYWMNAIFRWFCDENI